MNKRGVHYAVILSLILGLVVLTFAFVFQEAIWGEDTGDMEVCRQSILARAMLPEVKKAGINWAEFKSDFPLKCRTKVVEIEKVDVVEIEKAQRKIAEAMSECWNLYKNGDSSAFPSKFYSTGSVCVPCARVHLTEDAKDYMEKEEVADINIREALDLDMNKDFRYYNYLENSGEKFPAFNPAFARAFDLEGDSFVVDEGDEVEAIFVNRQTGGKDDEIGVGINKVSLPEALRVGEGDLLINYGVVTSSKEGAIGDYIPYLFYFQAGQDVNPFEEVKKQLIDGPLWTNANVCESWEGIPA